MNVAVNYTEAGLSLVPIPAGRKAPNTPGWNTRERCVNTIEQARRLNGGNLGLAHLFCSPAPTCAIDIDDFDTAAAWLEQRGIDLVALLAADGAVQISSGRPNRAKLIYRLPHALQTAQPPGTGLEFRCASEGGLTHQDVLPPSIHPDTGAAYEWRGDFRKIPNIPDALLELWQELANGTRQSKRPDEKEDADSDPVLAVLKERGLLLHRIEPGKYAITCPYSSSHTTTGGSSGTAYFLPWYHGFQRSHFKCLHSHCSQRSDTDFLRALGIEGAKQSESSPDWPVMDPAAFVGLAGDIVRTIEPESEADPVALLLQTLAAFGVLVGRGPHVRVESDEHHAALNLLLVGPTAKARKGTSLGRVHGVFKDIPDWPRVEKGLSSGEGVKWALRDPIYRIEVDKKTKEVERIEVDPGIDDKRLCVVEEEFAQCLRVGQRPGNTLSVVIREAWDGKRLGSLTKHDPVSATGVHVSIIGHITKDELMAELTNTDAANGYANRFLFCLARRSKALPFGGSALTEEFAALAQRLQRAANGARQLQAVSMSESARAVWVRIYPELSEGHGGLFGAATARGEAQCLRLALIYALLERSSAIDREHLLAALAVWDYCENSARYIFGTALGDRIADEVLRALKTAGKAGMSRTEISHLFGRHESSERIGAALDLLKAKNLARHETRTTGGRPVETWYAK